jgi:hypothetical protein
VDREVRIMGSKGDLLRTLAAISGVKSATGGVRSSVLDWRISVLARKPDMDCETLQRSWEGYVDHGQLIMRGFVAIFESDARARGSRFHAATMLTVEA